MSELSDLAVIKRLSERLHELWLPTELALPTLTALVELRDWLADEHWWKHGSHAGWLSLAHDVATTLQAMGARLAAHAEAAIGRLDGELAAFGSAVRVDKRAGKSARDARTETVRASLAEAEQAVSHALSTPGALGAAWVDLLDAARAASSDATLDQRQADLVDIAEQVGHPADRLLRMINGVLADSARSVDEAQHAVDAGEVRIRQREPERGPSGTPISQRLALVERYLRLPVATASSEVWIAVEDAFFEGPRFDVGPVTFWHGPRLRGALEGKERFPLPQAARASPEIFAWLWEERRPRASFALAQVPIVSHRPSDARDNARDTVRALLALAEFDERYTAWRVAGGGLLHFVDGQWVYRSKLDPGDEPAGPRLARLARDNTPAALTARAPQLAAHLPLQSTTQDVRHAFELLHWLSSGRAATSAARIVLTRRVLERAAGWAHVTEEHFTELLAVPWARRQVITRIGETTSAAIAALERDPNPRRHRAWIALHNEPRRIVRVTGGGSQIIETTTAVEQMMWLREQLPDGSEERRAVERLAPRIANPATLAEWIDELLNEFAVLRNRASRHRNAIIHGGPLDEASIATVLLFVDALAVDALAAARGRPGAAEPPGVLRSPARRLRRVATRATNLDRAGRTAPRGLHVRPRCLGVEREAFLPTAPSSPRPTRCSRWSTSTFRRRSTATILRIGGRPPARR